MAVHDRWFIPVLGAGCALEVGLIAVFHTNVGSVVTSVLTALIVLFLALAVRALFLMPRLRPEMVDAPDGPPATGGPL
jgi:hypothetical protein